MALYPVMQNSHLRVAGKPKDGKGAMVVFMKNLFILILAFSLGSCTAVRVVTHVPTTNATKAPPGIYEVDPDHQSLVFSVGHLGFSRFVARFDEWTGELDFNSQNPEQSTLNVNINATSLSAPTETMTQAIRGPDMLDVATHPEMLFSLRDISLTGETTGRAKGVLTIKGRSADVEMDIEFIGGGRNPLTRYYTLGFSAKGTLNRRDFGLNAWPIAVTNEVDFEIEVEFRKKSE